MTNQWWVFFRSDRSMIASAWCDREIADMIGTVMGASDWQTSTSKTICSIIKDL